MRIICQFSCRAGPIRFLARLFSTVDAKYVGFASLQDVARVCFVAYKIDPYRTTLAYITSGITINSTATRSIYPLNYMSCNFHASVPPPGNEVILPPLQHIGLRPILIEITV